MGFHPSEKRWSLSHPVGWELDLGAGGWLQVGLVTPRWWWGEGKEASEPTACVWLGWQAEAGQVTAQGRLGACSWGTSGGGRDLGLAWSSGESGKDAQHPGVWVAAGGWGRSCHHMGQLGAGELCSDAPKPLHGVRADQKYGHGENCETETSANTVIYRRNSRKSSYWKKDIFINKTRVNEASGSLLLRFRRQPH